jgi:hypothetical protein
MFAHAASAQWVVYDPTNYAQALSTYTQVVEQYRFWVRQARRLPVDMANRYRVPETVWRTYDIDVPNLPALISGFNDGKGVAARYRASVDPLDAIDDVLPKAPAVLRARLGTRYGSIALADSMAQLGIQQAGAIRGNAASVLRAIQAMEDDAVSAADDYNSQTALLNKINGASVLGLRIAEQGTQFLGHALEQLLLDNLRKREAEAQLMNAHVYQWRFGERYGQDLFRKTAAKLDMWRQP